MPRLDKRWRTIAFAALPIIILVACLAMVASWRKASLAPKPDDAPAIAKQIAILPDGVVIFAPDGSVGQALVDWLDSSAKGTRYFEVGGRQFVGKSVEPTPAARSRLKGLVDIMNAYPDLKVSVIGFTGEQGSSHDNLLLSARRAQRVVDLVVRDGIAPDRLSAEGKGESRVPGTDDPSQAERVGFSFDKS